mmetsp:Transcript_37927/g.90073  ORF Transcript_37927/g.90073 Transcript_37927/m.90073 type:complete len:297 (+) Transcript_37927:856-1746(+)
MPFSSPKADSICSSSCFVKGRTKLSMRRARVGSREAGGTVFTGWSSGPRWTLTDASSSALTAAGDSLFTLLPSGLRCFGPREESRSTSSGVIMSSSSSPPTSSSSRFFSYGSSPPFASAAPAPAAPALPASPSALAPPAFRPWSDLLSPSPRLLAAEAGSSPSPSLPLFSPSGPPSSCFSRPTDGTPSLISTSAPVSLSAAASSTPALAVASADATAGSDPSFDSHSLVCSPTLEAFLSSCWSDASVSGAGLGSSAASRAVPFTDSATAWSAALSSPACPTGASSFCASVSGCSLD